MILGLGVLLCVLLIVSSIIHLANTFTEPMTAIGLAANTFALGAIIVSMVVYAK